MSGNTDLSAEHTMRTHLSCSGNATLSRHHRIFSHHHIVSDLNQIIQFYAFFYTGRPHSCPVNTSIGTNLDIIFNNDITRIYIFNFSTIAISKENKE